MNKKSIYCIENFLLNDAFVAMAERNCPEEHPTNNIEDILCNLLLSTPFTFSREDNKYI